MAQKYVVTPILLALALCQGCSPLASGAVGLTSTPLPASRTTRTAQEAPSDAQAGLGQDARGGQGGLSPIGAVAQETPRAKNPSQLRAEARPKSLEDVKGLSGYDEVSSKSQPSSSVESVQDGKALYSVTCSRCHGSEGKAKDDTGTLGRYNMANLSDPLQYKYGADGRGIYRSLAYGTAAPPHGMYKNAYTEAQLWNLVSYVQTLQR